MSVFTLRRPAPVATAPRVASRSRAGLTAVDQILSSAGNGVILLAAAAVASADDFGWVALAFTAVAMVLGFGRGFLGLSLLAGGFSRPRSVTGEAGRATSVGLLVGTVLGVLLGLIGHATPVATAFWLVAASLPFTLAQDILRHFAFGIARPGTAAIWDAVWTVPAVVMFVLCLINPSRWGLTAVILTWLAGAVVSCIGLMVALGIRPQFDALWRAFRPTLHERFGFAMNSGLAPIGNLLVLIVVSAHVGVAGSGALRGANTLLSAVAVLSSTVPVFIIPGVARRGEAGHDAWPLLCRAATALGVAALLNGLFFLLLPSALGRRILGDTYPMTREILLVVALEYALTGWVMVVVTVLQIDRRGRETMILRIVYTALLIGLAYFAAVLTGSVVGAAWGLLVATAVVAGGSMLILRPWQKVRA